MAAFGTVTHSHLSDLANYSVKCHDGGGWYGWSRPAADRGGRSERRMEAGWNSRGGVLGTQPVRKAHILLCLRRARARCRWLARGAPRALGLAVVLRGGSRALRTAFGGVMVWRERNARKKVCSGAIRLIMALARPNAVDESDHDSESRSREDERAAERRHAASRTKDDRQPSFWRGIIRRHRSAAVSALPPRWLLSLEEQAHTFLRLCRTSAKEVPTMNFAK